VLLVDYVVPMAEIVERSPHWLRTFAAQQRGVDPLEAPGTQDLTADVVTQQLERASQRAGLQWASIDTQADWLTGLGLDEVVAQARATWSERAHIGDLEALMARSWVNEAAALSDPSGLGSFAVVRLTTPRVA
jgi:SAM-dependent MidA family methyltransferase